MATESGSGIGMFLLGAATTAVLGTVGYYALSSTKHGPSLAAGMPSKSKFEAAGGVHQASGPFSIAEWADGDKGFRPYEREPAVSYDEALERFDQVARSMKAITKPGVKPDTWRGITEFHIGIVDNETGEVLKQKSFRRPKRLGKSGRR